MDTISPRRIVSVSPDKTPSYITALRTKVTLARAVGEVAALDSRLSDLWQRAGTPGLYRGRQGFPGLFRIVVSQQLSFHAAAAIWRRVEEICEPLSAEMFLDLNQVHLRRTGLSHQKIRFGRALAQAIVEGRFRPQRLARLDDELAIGALIELDGIGRWSAECYLLFSLGRSDVWPANDLALAVACQSLLSLPERPKGEELRVLAERWRPWRSAAARLLWHGYRKQLV